MTPPTAARPRLASALLLLSLAASGCGPLPAGLNFSLKPVEAAAGVLATPQMDETPVPTATPEPTLAPGEVRVVEPEGAGESEPQPGLPQPGQAATQPPLRFVFPTPGPHPISAWRPPLYSVPWALTPNDHFYFSRPIAADEVNWPLADYRYGGVFPGKDNVIHTGIDIDARTGTPVLAAAGGKVVWAGYGLFTGANNPDDPYGLAVSIKHDFGYQGRALYTTYAHMRQIDVVTGQTVEQGQKLGEVGETGLVTGPHLHFEVRLSENEFFTTRNPELWLVPPQGWGVLAGRVTTTAGLPLYRTEVQVRSKETSGYWTVMTYGSDFASRSDEYYGENMVLSDLPAGDYTVTINYLGAKVTHTVSISPGRVTYFNFQGFHRFTTDPPAPVSFSPDPITPTATP